MSDAKNVKIRQVAPDFILKDVKGRRVCLSDFSGRKNVLLVLNRGFL